MSIVNRIINLRAVAAARATVSPFAAAIGRWLLEETPLFGQKAAKRRRRVVLEPYSQRYTLRGPILAIITIPILLVICFAYGFAFGLTAPFIMVPYFIPILLILGIIIWALPDQQSPPTAILEYLFPAFFIILILWPNYLAISLPGLPWITLLRVVAFPMSLALLINLSVSRKFRQYTSESVTSIMPLWIFMVGFVTVMILTCGVSSKPFASAQAAFNFILYWFVTFIVATMIFRDFKYVERYLALLCGLGVSIILLVIYEDLHRHIPWAAHIPGFLKVSGPSVQNTLRPSFRDYTNIYRSKGTFNTPLALAEYLSLLTPTFMYFGFYSKKPWIKAGCLLMVPVLFVAIRMTDARLGVVGILVSVLLYGCLWSVVRWRSRPGDLFAAATVYGYPAVFVAGVGAVFASTRLNQMVFGGGAQAGSTAARQTQLSMALESLSHRPWGYGTGNSGLAMGFADKEFITIDNYFIAVVLDYGVLGAALWYSMFITAIAYSLRYCLSSKYAGTREARILAPLAITLIAFLIIKWVHGQDDNHPVYFMLLGMISALVFNIRKQDIPFVDGRLIEERRAKPR